MPTSPLTNRVILVTGAAKRIGRAIALRLSHDGALVAIHYNHSEVEARATAAECNNAPIFQADLTKVSEVEALFTQVAAHFGRLDGLVNNAARFTRIDPLKVTEADWDFIHDMNLKATFFCCQQGALQMRKSGAGRIVNLSSLGALRAWPEHAHYCASKAGVVMLTRALSQAFAPMKISVNSVAPGVIPAGNSDERIEHLIQKTPAGRAGTPEEIADAVAYFLSASEFVTGQVMAVDGGLSQK